MDIIVTNHGSIFLIEPVSQAAKDWVEEHIPEDAQWFGPSFVVEHRFVNDIISGMAADGLDIE